MHSLHFAAALVAARHDVEDIQTTLIAGLRECEDKEETLVEVVGLLVGLLHGAGHISGPASLMLDVFAQLPESVGRANEDVHIVKIDDLDSGSVASMFDDVTTGTVKEDRLWSCRVLPGGVHAVVLEGSGFAPRYVAVLGGDHEQVEALRGQFAARDGR